MVKKVIPPPSSPPRKAVSKKRKKDESGPEINYLLMSSVIQDQTGNSTSAIQDSLKDVGVTVGVKTQRDRLLGLLSWHVIRKKPQMSKRLVPDITPRCKDNRFVEACDIEIPSQLSDEGPNYSLFSNPDLVEMIRGVGLDATDFDRTNLIKMCKTYSELNSSRDQSQQPVAGPLVPTIRSSEPKEVPDSSPDCSESQQPVAGPSVSSIRSLKNIRSKKPGVRSIKKSLPKPRKSGKGKLKARGSDDYTTSHSGSDDYVPSNSGTDNSNPSDTYISEASDDENSNTRPNTSCDTSRPKGRQNSKGTFTLDSVLESGESLETNSIPEARDGPDDSNPKKPSKNESDKLETGSADWVIQRIYKLEAHIARTDKRLEAISEKFDILSDVVDKRIGTCSPKGSGTKSRGGQTSVSCFSMRSVLNQD
ncbi:uncharacterized protein MELLADRAFT_68941 [Melampsora larici-populina 98AG31]|uniref:Uncharacterized protein n=1 Tax=Melampsora larici-populina (strain 98AG31 / pathotype 3-4-7) TaxID=747676 RepID=F4S8T2_MELLP|nr:uncharacterized protein MELLADRAFT_68941 [Melampsora larici-populina 98AG31]EGF98970.1 hypothetical protein MELLADRAFT_68941 [Melampsora larici-populina 98AG31]